MIKHTDVASWHGYLGSGQASGGGLEATAMSDSDLAVISDSVKVDC